MKEKVLYAVWGCLYILCVGLGFIQDAAGFGKFLLILISVLFFTPGVMLLQDGIQTKNRKEVLRVRLICILSLSLTFLLIIANFMTVRTSAELGSILYELLVLVSAPMVSSQYWVLSLFLWACLLMVSIMKCPKKQPK